MRMRRVLGILFCAAAVAGGCASVSGLDALEVCGSGTACEDASVAPQDGPSGADGSGGTDGGRLPDGAFPDVSFDVSFPDMGFPDVNFPFDVSPPPFDAKNDTSPPPPVDGGIPCGNLSCAQACCLVDGQQPACTSVAACTGGVAVACDKSSDCPNQGDLCCGKAWQDFPQGNATCLPAGQCQYNTNDAVLCVPDAGGCPGGNVCFGQFMRDGVTFHYCI